MDPLKLVPSLCHQVRGDVLNCCYLYLMHQHSGKTYAEGYEWFEFLPHVVPELVPEPDGDVYEVVYKVRI
jgi:hypothetical protein